MFLITEAKVEFDLDVKSQYELVRLLFQWKVLTRIVRLVSVCACARACVCVCVFLQQPVNLLTAAHFLWHTLADHISLNTFISIEMSQNTLQFCLLSFIIIVQFSLCTWTFIKFFGGSGTCLLQRWLTDALILYIYINKMSIFKNHISKDQFDYILWRTRYIINCGGKQVRATNMFFFSFWWCKVKKIILVKM